MPESSGSKPACHVIIFNIGKKHNVGTISRCCTAFGVASVCLVGSRHFNTFGAHGSDAHCTYRHFDTLDSCCAELREQEGCSIVGIEVLDAALPVHKHPFCGPTAFMLGNEGLVRSYLMPLTCCKVGSGTDALRRSVSGHAHACVNNMSLHMTEQMLRTAFRNNPDSNHHSAAHCV